MIKTISCQTKYSGIILTLSDIFINTGLLLSYLLGFFEIVCHQCYRKCKIFCQRPVQVQQPSPSQSDKELTLCSPCKNKRQQAQLGVPHSRIKVEICLILQAGTCQILNFAPSCKLKLARLRIQDGARVWQKDFLTKVREGGGPKTYGK